MISRRDIIAGATTAVVLVPQALAYAMLAGLPPVMGLYSALLPLIVYAVLGRSRQLAVGPVAIDSLLIGATLLGAIGADAPVVTAAISLAAMVGAFQLVFAALRLGFLTRYLARPVIRGFVSGSAILIGLSQLGSLSGADLPRGLVETLGALPSAQPHLLTCVVGAVAVVTIVSLKRYAPKFPRALVVVVVGIVGTLVMGFELKGVEVIGEVPRGLPPFAMPTFSNALVIDLIPLALTLALLGYGEAMSVAKTFAKKYDYSLAPNRELAALGASNLASALSGGYPVTGGLSRSAVNDAAGAQSRWAPLVTASVVAIVVLFLTDAIRPLPKAVLGAIILVASLGLFEFKYGVKLVRERKRHELAVALAAFFLTVIFGPVIGLVGGVVCSVPWLVNESRAKAKDDAASEPT